MSAGDVTAIIIAVLTTIPAIIAAWRANSAANSSKLAAISSEDAKNTSHANSDAITAVHDTINGSGALVEAIKHATADALNEHDAQVK